MNHSPFVVAFLCLLSLFPLSAALAQEPLLAPPPADIVEERSDSVTAEELNGKIQAYIYDIALLQTELPVANKKRLKAVLSEMRRINAKFDMLMTAHQDIIAADSTLMELMGEYREQYTQTEHDVNKQLGKRKDLDDFLKIEKYFTGRDTIYQSCLNKATLLSLTPTTAKQLAELKKDELLMRKEMDSKYAEADAIAAQNPIFHKRMTAIRNSYNSLAILSDQVQAAEYKSFFQRFKDYIYSFAAVSIILMFFGMLTTKIKAARDLRKQAKKLKEIQRTQNTDYPTI